MKLLAIETSCDETAVSLIEASGDTGNVSYRILGNALYSQAEKHAAFGGVYPSLAKREHAANLVPLLESLLTPMGLVEPTGTPLDDEQREYLKTLLSREEKLFRAVTERIPNITAPDIDAIAVTRGPGLEPALWVGVNFARALAYLWDVPIIPINHLEGHMVASAVDCDERASTWTLQPIEFPVVGLILSGGHTEFVYAPSWGSYEVIGATRDDSIGEAFDKVARMLELPYPGGPHISRLADKGRHDLHTNMVNSKHLIESLPRPMLHSGDLDFSFSGLKTAVLYQLQDRQPLNDELAIKMATEFEEAVTEVVLTKTKQALESHPAPTFVLGGGVSANSYLRKRLAGLLDNTNETKLLLPAPGLSTDNAIMIGMAGYLAHLRNEPTLHANDELRADGNLSLER